MKRALVTGGSGFFGVHAVKELIARGYDVHVAGRRVNGPPEAHYHVLDLMDAAAVKELLTAVRPAQLLHLAWNVGSGFWTAEDNIAWASVTTSLIRSFHEAGGQRFVGVGSCAEYGWEDVPPFIPETWSRKPATLYGSAKESVRLLLDAYARQTGLSYGWAVLFMSYGADERPERLVPSVVRQLLAGEATRTTDGMQVRDFLESRDVGRALAMLLDSSVQGTVNVASGQPVALREVITKLGEAVGRPDLVRFGDLPSRANEPPRLVANVAKLKQDLAFEPGIDLDRGLREAVQWWRQKLNSGS
jgi:nucleoside-diphosphate-sugar epimerase